MTLKWTVSFRSPDVSIPGTRWWVEVCQSFRLHRCCALNTFAASLGICRNSFLSSKYDGLEESLSFLPFEQLLLMWGGLGNLLVRHEPLFQKYLETRSAFCISACAYITAIMRRVKRRGSGWLITETKVSLQWMGEATLEAGSPKARGSVPPPRAPYGQSPKALFPFTYRSPELNFLS